MNNHKSHKVLKPGTYHVISESDYEEGKAELTLEQIQKLKEISYLITGYTEAYSTMHRSYTALGILQYVFNHINMKIQNKELSPREAEQAWRLHDEARQLCGVSPSSFQYPED